MSHSPEDVKQYICENCQVVHAGTPIHQSGGTHRWEAPDSCGACGESRFVDASDWIHHHE